jgi:hypothetical protein
MFEHLNALRVGLSNEKSRLEITKNPTERVLRNVWIRQIEREIDGEIKFLNDRGYFENVTIVPDDLTDEELLKELLE